MNIVRITITRHANMWRTSVTYRASKTDAQAKCAVYEFTSLKAACRCAYLLAPPDGLDLEPSQAN